MKIGINGFGCFVYLVFRALWGGPGLELVQVNDPTGDAQTAAHLLEDVVNFGGVGRGSQQATSSSYISE